MKNYIKCFSLFLMAITLFSCSNDNNNTIETTFIEENFLPNFLATTGFNQVTEIYVDDTTFEVGFDFTPKVNGKITSLRVKLPDINTSLRITIWDKGTSTVIKSELVDVASGNTEFTFDITDVELVKDTEYAISMNTSDYFVRSRTDEGLASYPIAVGNIQIDACKLVIGSSQTYPNSFIIGSYTGDLSFGFLQTE